MKLLALLLLSLVANDSKLLSSQLPSASSLPQPVLIQSPVEEAVPVEVSKPKVQEAPALVELRERVIETTRAVRYPIHKQRWDWQGVWNISRAAKINHLLTHANHSSKFSSSWLNSLSDAELWSLHDDDHEGKVKWKYVPTSQVKQKEMIVNQKQAFNDDSKCPGGKCPTVAPVRRLIFRRR